MRRRRHEPARRARGGAEAADVVARASRRNLTARAPTRQRVDQAPAEQKRGIPIEAAEVESRAGVAAAHGEALRALRFALLVGLGAVAQDVAGMSLLGFLVVRMTRFRQHVAGGRVSVRTMWMTGWPMMR